MKADEITAAKAKLAELKREADALSDRRDDLTAQTRGGRDSAQTEAAARALIAGRTMTIMDVDAELADINSRLKVNARARDLLADTLGVAEVREGYRAAAPLFAKAVAHIPKLAKLLEAVEAELRIATADLREYEEVHMPAASVGTRYPAEKPPFQDWQLDPIRFGWREDFVGDGTNPSKLDRWRADCAELGLSLKA